MYFRGKDLKDFTLTDIEEMIQDKVTESNRIEFKQEMWGSNHDGKKEMLKDISAMANAFGGAIFLGIREENHTAVEIKGIEDAQDMESIIYKVARSTIDENILGLMIHIVPISNQQSVLIIEIPEGASKPHMINFDKHIYFYRRVGTDNHPMDIREIREMVLYEENAMERTEDFFKGRVQQIREQCDEQPNLVFSALPRRLFSSTIPMDSSNANAVFGPDFSFEYADMQHIFDRYDYVTRFNLAEPEFKIDGIRANYIKNYETQDIGVSHDVFENGYIEVVGDYRQLVRTEGEGKGLHPLDILRILLNTAHILKKLSTRYNLRTRYELRLWTPTTRNFAVLGPRDRTHPRSNDWTNYNFGEAKFYINAFADVPFDEEDTVIYPVFKKLLRAFNLPDPYFSADGRILTDRRRYI